MFPYMAAYGGPYGDALTRRHRYDRLDNAASPDMIRLLRILPYAPDGTLILSLEEYRLESAPPYSAISYCWGGGQARRVLAFCNHGRIQITENLDSALRAIYRRGGPPYVWADAICINQEDEVEKSEQVSLMRAIYSRASFTHIWLGYDSENGDLEKAFKMIGKYAKKTKQSDKGLNDIDLLPRMLDFHLDRHANFKPEYVRSLWLLLQREWFKRIWVIQEAAFSVNAEFIAAVGAGRYLNCSWDDFHSAMLHFASHGIMRIFMSLDDDLAFRMVQSRVFVKSLPGHGAGDLLHLLQEHRSSQATNPRDKIFALLGLTGSVHCHQHCVDINYEIPTSELYTKVARSILTTRQDLDILSVYRIQGSPIQVPSWVPNWAESIKRPIISMRARYRGYYMWPAFDASRSDQPSIRIANNNLFLGGQPIDHITSIGEEFDPSPGLQGDLNSPEIVVDGAAIHVRVVNNWKTIAGIHLHETYWTGERLSDAFLRTTIWDHLPPGVDINNLRAVEELARSMFGKVHECLSSKWKAARLMTQHWHQLEKHGGSVVQSMRYFACLRRKMFRTLQGFIGLAPPLAQKGDLIVIFEGAAVPHVIRERQNGYELIGDCYVHGVMKGEVFDSRYCERICLV